MSTTRQMQNLAAMATLGIFALAGCGGGSNSSDDTEVVEPTPEPAPTFAPTIISQPDNTVVRAGDAATFAVEAQGSGPLTYQWKQNGVAIGGTNQANYAVVNASQLDHGNIYQVQVSNSQGFIDSAAAFLFVLPATPNATLLLAGSDSFFDLYAEDFQPLLDGEKGGARFYQINSLTVDHAGNAYVIDTSTIRRITPWGTVSTLAGQAGDSVYYPDGFGYADGSGSAARFDNALDVAVDSQGTLYIADANNAAIRTLDPATGEVQTLAGGPGKQGYLDGPLAQAQFREPRALAVDRNDNILVLDAIGDEPFTSGRFALRKITADGQVSTVPGGLIEKSAQHVKIAIDANDNVYLAINHEGPRPDGCTGFCLARMVAHYILRLTPSGDMTVFAGMAELENTYSAGFADYADGLGSQARFSTISAISADSQGNLWLADNENHAIRKITPSGEVSTLMKATGEMDYLTGFGPIASTKLLNPGALAVGPLDYLWYSSIHNTFSPQGQMIGSRVLTLADPSE